MGILQLTITSGTSTFLRDGGSIGVTVALTGQVLPAIQLTPQNGQLVGGIAQGQTKVFSINIPTATAASQFDSVMVTYHPNGGIDEDRWDATIVAAFIPDTIQLPFACNPARFRSNAPSFEMLPPAGTCIAM